LVCVATLFGAWVPRAALAQRPTRSSALLVFLPAGGSELASVKGLSLGIVSATQGGYTSAQFLLDMTQGTRVASSAYATRRPPALSLRQVGAGASVAGWQAALRRAEDAPQLLQPGLLAGRIPGGAAYVGISGATNIDGVAAAGRDGRIAAVSLGTPQTLLARIAALRETRSLVVADLPAGGEGYADLRALSEARRARELLIVLERAPNAPGHELLWLAVGGLKGGGAKELSSTTTNQPGLVAAIDIAPTILRHLSPAPPPAEMRGAPIRTGGALRLARLRGLMGRLEVIGPRRLRALGILLGVWALVLLCSAPWPRARSWALRTGGLGVLWAPIVVLLPAALEPSAAVEYALIALGCLGLGALTERLLPWPRAPLAPAIAALVVLAADALAGSQLLMRSLLGPDPIIGARFYGIGNELKSSLAVLVLAGVAAALYPVGQLDARGPPATRRLAPGRRPALAMAFTGVVLAVVEGSAKIGAGVGGVILVSAGFAVATVLLLPGASRRRRVLSVLIAPVLGLLVLAVLDLATAHGSGHYTGSILHARSAGDLRDVIVRRYRAAWDELHNHAMPAATVVALLAAAVGLRRQERLLAPVANDACWRAALAGGLTAGIVGALVEDSGPVLLVVALFALVCVLSYLWGRPDLAREDARERSPHTTRPERSHARTLSAEPSR
jgi:hypothetical protein